MYHCNHITFLSWIEKLVQRITSRNSSSSSEWSVVMLMFVSQYGFCEHNYSLPDSLLLACSLHFKQFKNATTNVYFFIAEFWKMSKTCQEMKTQNKLIQCWNAKAWKKKQIPLKVIESFTTSETLWHIQLLPMMIIRIIFVMI